ncbi:MAG: hypothetical protein II411_01710 [Lachnospiraceae bacterium]|nr:hypothetical protein [Lachnospiraceae bacterium]
MDEKEIDNEYGLEEETSERADADADAEVQADTSEVEESNSSVEDSSVESQEAESNNVDFENNYTEPQDYSWLVNVSDEDISKALEDKASDLSTAEAKSGISTELNNPFHEEAKSEFMENEVIPFATPKELETGWRDTSKPGNTKEELEEAQKKLDENKELFTPEQKRAVADFDPNKGSTITDIAHILTFGLAPTFNKIDNFDKVAYSSFVEKRAKETGDAGQAIREVNKLIEGSQLGLAKEGIEYWRETGQTLGNKYAEQAEQAVTSALIAYNDGKIDDKTLETILDTAVNPSNSAQLGSLLSSPALKGLEIYGLGAAAGAAIGKGLSIAAEKITPKIVDKLIQTSMSNSKAAGAAEKVLKMLSSSSKVRAELSNSKKFDVYKKFMEKDLSGDFYKTEFGKQFVDTYGKMLANQINEAVKIANSGDDILRIKDIRVVTDAIQKGIITGEDVVKAVAAANNVSEDTAKKVAAASGITVGAVKGAEAAPTGIFNDKGKMVDSKEIVSERKDNPYAGEDAVTLYTREGKVEVSPREAVIIGEAEGLPPSSGYTDKVKEAAKGSEVYEQPPVQMVQPTDEQIGFWQKAGDVIQAILGGRDLNNDKTITKSEWYESTIGKVADKFKEAFSGNDAIDKVGEKSVWQKVKDKFSSVLESVGNSIPGVVDLKNGTAYINPALDRPNLDLSPQAITGTIENAVANSLPNWSDTAGQELKKGIVSATVSEVLASNVFGNFGVITAAKIVGQYVTSTVSEIAHLYGKDLDNDEKGAINFIVTNAVGLPFAPVSAAIRDTGASLYGVTTRQGIERIFENGSDASDFYIIPYDTTNTKPESSTEYGTATDKTAADSKYSGYREQAKDSNLATDYNEGMEKETNEAVSSKDVKKFIVKTYNSEPEYVRNSLNKIIATLKGETVF